MVRIADRVVGIGDERVDPDRRLDHRGPRVRAHHDHRGGVPEMDIERLARLRGRAERVLTFEPDLERVVGLACRVRERDHRQIERRIDAALELLRIARGPVARVGAPRQLTVSPSGSLETAANFTS